MNPAVDTYLRKAKAWKREMEALRKIILRCDVEEELKWGKPCYTHGGGNLIVVQAFKAYCALLFFKGALLRDPRQLLLQVGENTQAARHLRFTSLEEIVALAPVIESYTREAIELQRAGLKVAFKKVSDYPVPEEFQAKLDALPALRKAFEALTPGRQKGYLLYFAGAKQSKTRESRVEKCRPRILAGKGLDDA